MSPKIADIRDLVPSFFIAYCHLDEERAVAIRACFEEELGFKVMTMRDNRTGDDFEEKSRHAVRTCTCTVPILTENYTPWIEREVGDAEGQGKIIFPIMIGEQAKHAPWKTISMRHLHCYFPSTDRPDLAEHLVKAMVEAKLLTNGIVPRKLLEVAASFKHDPLAPCEQFACELIEQPLIFSRTPGQMTLDLDRRPEHSCKYVALSNAGKRQLQKHFVNHRRAGLERADIELLAALGNRTSTAVDELQSPDGLPLRWASGGVLPLVKFRNRRWVALLFRDIAPYGWNLPMGASERYAGTDDQATATELWKDELRHPEHLVTREFLEEFLVLDGKPTRSSSGNRHIRRFDFMRDPIERVRAKYRRFNGEHVTMRQNQDKLRFSNSESSASNILITERQVQHCRISVDAGAEHYPVHGFYVSVNLLELGIELILPLEFALGDNDYILDGEILKKDDRVELVRMPIALISADYLRRAFPRDRELAYVSPALPLRKDSDKEPQPPSIDAGMRLGPDDIHVFEWDIRRRHEIAEELRDRGGEEWKRHQRWVDLFGDAFKGPDPKYPTYFTPASAKTLQALRDIL